MKLSRLEEKALIDAIRAEFQGTHPGLDLGIGDDAAVIETRKKKTVITKDLLIADVHFIERFHPPRLLGRKCLNVNLSDLAAMGAFPQFALLGMGLPRKTDTEWIREFFAGFKSAAKQYGLGLIGGDITRAQKVTISVTLLGEAKNVIRRSDAKPGHRLFVSGSLGDAKEGLILMKKGIRLGRNRQEDRMLKAFMDPKPQIELGMDLARSQVASAMIDTSDGLSTDLGHLCEASACGAEICLEKLPVSDELRALQRKARDFALNGGEDYQLLFTVPETKLDALKKLTKKYTFTPIGKMIEKKKIVVIDSRSRRKTLRPKPWHHF